MRPTEEQIDHEIVDTAAGLFAVHGYTRTSVQQLADAVGYSKTGLLHRFGSKDALYTAVVEAITTAFDEILDEAGAMPIGEKRIRHLVEQITGVALENPGLVQFFFEATRPHNITTSPDALMARIDRFQQVVDSENASPEQRMRVVLGFYLIVNAALTPDDGLGDRFAPLVTELAERVAIEDR